jgi:ABC-type amino acid transport system permease subunit
VPFDIHFIARLIPALLEGAVITVELAVLTFLICLIWGLLVALAQLTHPLISSGTRKHPLAIGAIRKRIA